jgi:hypothetical protein
MTLLAPWDAAIAAALGVPALLLLYMLKLRRRPLRVGSILFWPAAERDVQANEPLRWIRPSWLFFMHLLALLLLVTALGRPTARSKDQLSSRVVLIMDASASMSAINPNAVPAGTRLDAGKARAAILIDDLLRGSARREIAVIVLAAEARTLQGFTGSRAALLDAINGVTPTDQPGNLKAAIDLADAISAQAGDDRGSTGVDPAALTDAEPPTIVLLSDGSFREPPGGALPALGPRVRFERIGPDLSTPDRPAPPAPSTASPPSSLSSDNVGIVGIAAKRDANDPTVLRLFVDLENASESPTTAGLVISLNGQPIARRAVELPAAKAGSNTANTIILAEPGRAASTFELSAQTAGVLLVALQREDLLAADNAAALVLPESKRPAILLVQPADASAEPSRAATLSAGGWLLSDALAELRPRVLQTATPEQYLLRAASNGLAGVDLIVFDRVTPERWPSTPTLSFGVVPNFASLRTDASTTAQTGALIWQRNHPILKFVALEGLIVAQTLGVQAPAPTDPASSVVELIKGQQGPLLILANDRGVRRLVTCFDLSQSNWPLQLSFPIFLSNALEVLAFEGDQNLGRAFRTDEPALVRVTPGDSTLTLQGPITLQARGPNAPVRSSPDLGTGTAPPISLGLVPRAGVYQINGNGAIDQALTVNLLDETESALRAPERITIGLRPIASGGQSLGSRELWPWFLIAALVLLCAEWVVYGRGVRA